MKMNLHPRYAKLWASLSAVRKKVRAIGSGLLSENPADLLVALGFHTDPKPINPNYRTPQTQIPPKHPGRPFRESKLVRPIMHEPIAPRGFHTTEIKIEEVNRRSQALTPGSKKPFGHKSNEVAVALNALGMDLARSENRPRIPSACEPLDVSSTRWTAEDEAKLGSLWEAPPEVPMH